MTGKELDFSFIELETYHSHKRFLHNPRWPLKEKERPTRGSEVTRVDWADDTSTHASHAQHKQAILVKL